MNTKTRHNIKETIPNGFGVFGYLFCCLQWMWAVILYFSEYKDLLTSVLPKTNDRTNDFTVLTFSMPDTLSVILCTVVVVSMLILTVYAFIKMPILAVNNSKKAVRKSAEKIAPAAIKAMHKKPTKKMRIKITAELVIAVKAILIIGAMMSAVIFQYTGSKSIDYEIVEIVSFFLGGLSVIAFGLQYLLAWLLRVDESSIW